MSVLFTPPQGGASAAPYGSEIVGVETMSRGEISVPTASSASSGGLLLAYFTPRLTATCSTMLMYSGSTAAGATPTLVRGGFYTVAANGDLTLVCAIASDTTIFAAANTEYSRAFSTGGGLPASYTFQSGLRYAHARIIVSAAAIPTSIGQTNALSALCARAPRITGFLAGQSDLPTSITAGSVTNASSRAYAAAIA